MVVTLSDTSSPHNHGLLSLKTDSTSAYSLGPLHLPDLRAQELDPRAFNCLLILITL